MYEDALLFQKKIQENLLQGNGFNLLMILEHYPVYTLGKHSTESDILESANLTGVPVVKSDRGGRITYHGLGQLVVYPILDLRIFCADCLQYLRKLEDVMINFIRHYDINAERDENYTGVWVANKKIAAIGISLRNWITMHGISININNDLFPFSRRAPCGIMGRGVTSLSLILKQTVCMEDARLIILNSFADIFEAKLLPLKSKLLI